MDAGAMGERVGAHDRLVGLDVDAGDGAHQLASARELGGDDAGMGVERLLVHADRHDDLFERGIARALAQAVDSALNLRGAVADALEGERRSHAKVVMGVDGDGDVLDDAHEELLVGAAGVLRVELDIVHEAAGVLHRVHGALDGLVLGEAELVTQMAGGHAQTRMDARALRRAQGLGRNLDIAVDGAGEAADGAGVAGDAADLLHALEVARAGDGEPRLDDVDLHAHELAGDDELFLGVHACAGRLLAVAQGGIEDGNLTAHGASSYKKTMDETSCLAGGWRRYPRGARYHEKAPEAPPTLLDQGGCAGRVPSALNVRNGP